MNNVRRLYEPSHARIIITVILAISFVVLVAIAEGASRLPRRPDGRVGRDATTTWTRVSGCLDQGVEGAPVQQPATDCEGITIEAVNNAIMMGHRGAMLNCCADIAVAVQHPGDWELRFVEQEAGEMCFCLCPYDLTAGAGGLSDGVYLVGVFSSQGGLLCERRVQIGPGGLSAVSSGCKADNKTGQAAGEETVDIFVDGHSIVIRHLDAELNCCLELEVDVEASPGIYRVVERDRGEACFCMCPFDFEIVIPDVSSGEHLVELVGVDGETLVTVTVTVP